MTDNPLREVIARAICARDGGLRSCEGDSRCIDGDMCPYPALADAAIAAIEASGWVLVPAEPTQEQQIRGVEAMAKALEPFIAKLKAEGRESDAITLSVISSGHITGPVYRAMVAARPRDVASTDKEE